MGKRNTSRRLAMQALFEAEQSKKDIKEALHNIFDEGDYIKETCDFAAYLAKQTFSKKDELDKIICRLSKDWPLDRLAGVDRNILRLLLFELGLGETPEKVVIGEALNLVEKYSSPEAIKFINGIAGAYLKEKKNEKAID